MRSAPSSRAVWIAQHVLPHEPDLRKRLCRKVAIDIDIDDIIQETYAKLAMLKDVDHILVPRAYFFQTAYSVLLQENRRSRIAPIESGVDLEWVDMEAPEPLQDRQLEARQELSRVNEAIASLSAKCREVFILRKVQGLSQREIAAQLNLSESTVEKHINKGVRKLMDVFGRGGKVTLPASSRVEVGGRSNDEN